MSAPGRFLTLEGGEGVGKSTQAERLAAALRARGLVVQQSREPGGSPGAEAIRRLLLDGAAARWEPRTEALLFAAARADHVARLIRPALARGEWVVCDRFLDSSLAYQGAADAVGEAAIRQLHAIGSEGLLPDRTLLLTLSAQVAQARVEARDRSGGDRIGCRPAAFHQAVDRGFARIAADEPGRVRIIDASGAVDEVSARLLAAIDDLL